MNSKQDDESDKNDLFYIRFEGDWSAIGQIEIKGKIESIPDSDLDKIASDARYANYGVSVKTGFIFPKTGGRRKLKRTRHNRRKNRKSRRQRR